MSVKLAHYQLDHALRRFESVRDALYEQLGYVAEAEIAALARRFPTRRVEFHSGMGVSQIVVKHRTRTDYNADYQFTGNDSWSWPERLEDPCPDLWAAIAAVEAATDGKDPGLGVIVYENGKRLSGLN